MHIGIIGSDEHGVEIGRALRKSGTIISFSDIEDDRTSQSAAVRLGEGTYATTPYQQAAHCDAICLAVRWEQVDRALTAIGAFKDGIIIDATRPPDLGRLSGAELLAHKLDNPHVVKAFVEPISGNHFIKIAADDPTARAEVGELIMHSGHSPLDIGPLANARTIEREFAKNLPLSPPP
jgi:predicted dinucleotide-binding enzyme